MSEVLYSETLDRLKESFLWAAAQGGNVEDCESLLSIGADVNWKNLDGDTPLLAACRRGHSQTVALLLIHGADSNICGVDSFAPIHICARRGDYECMNALLEANTLTTVTTREGLTALDIAKAKGHTDIYTALMSRRGMPRGATGDLHQFLQGPSPAPAHPAPAAARNSTALPSLTRTNSSTAPGPKTPRGPPDNVTNGVSNVSNSELNAAPIGTQSRLQRAVSSNKVHATTTTISNVNGSSKENTVNRTESKSAKYSTNSTPAVALKDDGSRPGPPPSSYAIAGQQAGGYSVDDPALVSLRNALEKEIARRKTAEGKLDIFRDQNSQLLKELSSLNTQFNELQDDNSELESQLDSLLGRAAAMSALASVEECEELERTLKNSLEAVEERKTALIREKLGNQAEQRLCVICQEYEKSVVLLPCRHLCLCSDCSQHEQLKACPLCRQAIQSKFVVFS